MSLPQPNFPNRKHQRDGHTQQEHDTEHAAAAGLVVHLIIHGLFGVGDPAHSTGCFEAEVVSDDTLNRCAGCYSLFDGGYAESEFHVVLVFILSCGWPIIERPANLTFDAIQRYD